MCFITLHLFIDRMIKTEVLHEDCWKEVELLFWSYLRVVNLIQYLN